MNKKISNIPEEKQQELLKVLEIIQKIGDKKLSAEMIILFGSYARGDFVVRDVVSEGGGTRVYESDFDIFVITQKPTQEKNMRFAMDINTAIENDLEITTKMSIIIEDIFHVNKMLEEGRYFYVDIKNEGIILYDTEKYTLRRAKKLPPERRKQIQKEDYELWFKDAKIFFGHYKFDVSNRDFKVAAFSLHQATEKYMTAYLLVKTGYKPKTHGLKILYRKIKEQEPMFNEIFNLEDDIENNHFELLRKAYIEARYSKTYRVTREELFFLEEKILMLKDMVERFCKEELS